MIDETISEETTGTEPETINNEPSQDPLDVEIERTKKEGRSEAEKAAFSLKKNAERAKELGIDPAEILGLKKEEPKDNDEVPEWYKKEQSKANAKTALELADSIEDPKERELVQIALNSVVTSGTPEERLRVARGYVNSVRNGQLVEEISRAGTPKHFSSGTGAPAKPAAKKPELTPQEQQFTKPPFNMTPAQIIAARPKE